MHSRLIVVLGGGPAGCTVALGLNAMGYRVTLVSRPRGFAAVEGVSARVVDSLRAAGFVSALAQIAAPSPRQVTWNGVTSAANQERLIEREQFDAALLQDLRAAGVEVIEGEVVRCQSSEAGHQVAVESLNGEALQLQADFLVEARGRAASLAGLERVTGAQTLSLLQRWYGAPFSPASAVQSFADGWAWMARMPDGHRYLQLTIDVASSQLPGKDQLADWCHQRLYQLPQARAFIGDARPVGPVHGRTSGQVLCREMVGSNWIRVGDAAMAVDPLSGNGIFQALSSALQAPAVINNLLQRPQDSQLAVDFYRQRVEGLFYRFARTGRDFCAAEQQWPDRPFWQARRSWPDNEPLHQSVSPEQVAICRRPVVDNGLIREAEVVVTPDQPLGIWHYRGHELAPLLSRIRASSQPALQVLQEVIGEAEALAVGGWMRQMGLIG